MTTPPRPYSYQMVPDGTQSVLFCSWSILLAIWAHMSIRLAPAWIVSKCEKKAQISPHGLKINLKK